MEGEDLTKDLKKIFVVGATGKQGKSFVRHFCQQAKPHDNIQLKCLSRDTHSEKCLELVEYDDSGTLIECVHGDLNDILNPTKYHHFQHLTRDCNGMFIVLRTGEKEAEIGMKLIDLAREMNITWIVYSGVANADLGTGIPHFESKKRIQDYLLTHQSSFDFWTVIRPVYFFQNLLNECSLKLIKEQHILELPLPSNCKLQMVDVDNVGHLVANAFLSPQDFHNKIIDFVGEERTMAEYASCLGCQYKESDLGSLADRDMRLMFQWFQSEGYHGKIRYCQELFPFLTSFESWATKNGLISSEEYEKRMQSKTSSLESSQRLEAGSMV